MVNAAGNITIASLSDRGRKRLRNEDSIVSDAETSVVILADGLGGHNAGDVASALAVTVTHEQILQGLRDTDAGKTDEKTGLSSVSRVLEQAILQANSTIHGKAQKEVECHGMGTTIVVCVFHDDLVSAAHVGDSRLYRKRGEDFMQLTKDHFTWPWLDRALGIEENVLVDVMEEAVRTDDIYLLCSDGLTDMVDDEKIHSILADVDTDLTRTATELVQKANENGGIDNISVILVKIRA